MLVDHEGRYTTPVRIMYLGLPLGALHLIGNGFDPCVIALGHTDAPGIRRLRRRASPSTLILGSPDLNDPGVLRALEAASPDVIFSFFWPRRIPERVLRLAPRGAFGTHPSLLPRWRGPDPYFWALADGDDETGVTLHRLARDYDTGRIVEQRRVPITPSMNAWTLARALDRPALALLAEAARRLASGEALEGVEQGEDWTHAPVPGDEECSVDWLDDAATIVRLVRACAPLPSALAEIEGVTVEIVRASDFQGVAPRALEPAEAFVAEGKVVVVAGRGAVVIEAARDDAGEPFDLTTHVVRAQARRAQAS